MAEDGPDLDTKPIIDGSGADTGGFSTDGPDLDALGTTGGAAGGLEDGAGVTLSHILGGDINAARTAPPPAVAVTTGLLVFWQKVMVVRRVGSGISGR